MTTREEKAEALRANLPQFTGTHGYTRVTLGQIVATDGVLHLCEMGGAYWLMDVIGSYQPGIEKRDQRLADFQVWELKIVGLPDCGLPRGAVVTCCADSGERPKIKQVIEYTDFPLDEGITIYVTNGGPQGNRVAMLPSEY